MKWHKCPHCDFKTKQNANLKQHLADKYDIGVKWHNCPYCNYKAKHKSDITMHLTAKNHIHDIKR